MTRKRFEDLKDDLTYWFWNLSIFDYIYNIKNGVKNFWNYKSVIWNDRWYDHSYIIAVLKFKLQQNIKQWDKAHYVGSEFTKGRMIICLQRIEEFDTNLENLQELWYTKKITKDEFNELKKELLMKTWYSLGRNIQRFWD